MLLQRLRGEEAPHSWILKVERTKRQMQHASMFPHRLAKPGTLANEVCGTSYETTASWRERCAKASRPAVAGKHSAQTRAGARKPRDTGCADACSPVCPPLWPSKSTPSRAARRAREWTGHPDARRHQKARCTPTQNCLVQDAECCNRVTRPRFRITSPISYQSIILQHVGVSPSAAIS
jgi:hypothetical protein